MKKTTVLALSLLLLLLTACGQTAAPASSDTPNQADVPPVQEVAGTPFDRFEASLDDAGYAYETVTMAAELVGARIGVKYKFDFGTVELYQFEDDSDALAQATKDGGLMLEGFGVVRCDFNGSLAAIFDVTENGDTLHTLFEAL